MKDKYEQAIEREQTENDYAELFRRNRNSSLKTLILLYGTVLVRCIFCLQTFSGLDSPDRDRQYY